MGAEKRQCLSPAQISAHRKSVRNRSKALGVLSSPAFAPARSHSGSQGRRRGFCGLFGQRILYAATLGGGFRFGQLLPVELLHGLLRREDRVEQRAVSPAAVFQLIRSAQALCRERGVGSLTVCCAPCDEAMYQALGFNVPLGVSRSCLL